MTDRVQRLGVLGGMGPLAGAAFALRIVQLTPADRDQDHIPVLLWNDPQVPDRSSAKLGLGPDPFEAMRRGMLGLEAAGVDLIAIPCNTAHFWFDRLSASTPIRVLHIVEAVIDDLHRMGLHRGKVGVLGTPATLAMGLYQTQLEVSGFDCIVPTQEEVHRYCVSSIAAVKSNRLEDAYAPAAKMIDLLAQRGADAVVLGCTELPLAVPNDRRSSFQVLLTDSIDALARQAITAVGPHFQTQKFQ